MMKRALFVLIVGLLLVALACGGEEATPAGLTAEEARAIFREEAQAAAAPAGLTASEVQQIVTSAIAGAPTPAPGITAAEVASLIQQEVAKIPAGVSAADVERISREAAAAAAAPGVTREDLETAIRASLAETVAQAVAALATPVPTPAPVEEKPYFEGKTIRLVTSSNPGGGTDTQARYFAAKWGEFIPGKPRIVVSNVTPHVAGINYLWGAKNDGTVIAYISHSPLREEGFSEAVYDSKEFVYLGDIGPRTQVLAVRGNLGYETIQDIIGSEGPVLTFAAQAPNPLDIENDVLGWMLLAEFLDLPLEIKRVAETGTSVQILDTERGNINANQWGGGAWFLLGESRPDWFSENFIIPVLDLSLTGSRAAPNAAIEELDIPYWADLFTPQQVEQWQGMVEGTRNLNRPLWLPPGTPDEVVQILRKALEDALADEEFTSDYTRVTGAPIRYTPGEEALKSIIESQRAIAKWQDQVDTTKEELFPKYFP